MYKEHPDFTSPPSGELLWKYIDFTKFVSLLETGSLFFSNTENFDDPFEGYDPLRAVTVEPEELAQQFAEMERDIRLRVLVDCWHWNEFESAAMWKLYSEWDRGISIKTTVGELKESMICPEDIFVGTVQYIDYDSQAVDRRSVIAPYLTKRKSFEHEREVRAISIVEEPNETGSYYQVDVGRLIREVVVAPQSEAWFLTLVRAVMARYDLRAPVLQSTLLADPPQGGRAPDRPSQ